MIFSYLLERNSHFVFVCMHSVYAQTENISSIDLWRIRKTVLAKCADILLHRSMLSGSLCEQGNLTSDLQAGRLSAGDDHDRPRNERVPLSYQQHSLRNETQITNCLYDVDHSDRGVPSSRGISHLFLSTQHSTGDCWVHTLRVLGLALCFYS